MKFWVGVTDNDWFQFLANKMPDEVNFWQPSGRPPFKRAIEPGSPFLFKLKSPYNHIAGGGYFVKHTNLPVSIAWRIFNQKNGTSTYQDLLDKIWRYNKSIDESNQDPSITCTVVTQPFFFNQNDWIPAPKDWSSNLVSGRSYDSLEPLGAELWAEVETRIKINSQLLYNKKYSSVAEETGRYGSPYLRRNRLDQGAFQVIVTDAYNRQCAITGEKVLPVLEAAHIRPYSELGPHHINNGILLRVDWHRLFDRFYITLIKESQDSSFRIEVSNRIQEVYGEGNYYYSFQGKKLKNIPSEEQNLPGKEYIEWHNKKFIA